MFKQLLTIAIFITLATTSLSAKEFSYNGNIWVWGRGSLYASGTGEMVLYVKGTASFSGSGSVTIPAYTRYRTEKSRWISVRRSTTVTLSGAGDIIVHCKRGKQVKANGTASASINGRGSVYLKGSGSYSSSSWKKK